MNERTKQIIADIQKYKGENFVILCAVEEMAELSKELLKNINRGKDNRDDIVEEVADVLVCLEYIKIIYGISDAYLYEFINEKMPKKWSAKIEKWKAGQKE